MENTSYCGMITYTVNASADQTGFHVKIAGSDGNRQTMLGFRTAGAADAWIADDKRLTDHTAVWNPISSAARSESRSQQIEASLLGRRAHWTSL
jgi:hypothetical protein